MRRQHVEKFIQTGFGISVYLRKQQVDEFAPVAVAHEGNHRVFEGIIHHAVKLTALKILSAAAVSDFVGGVFPHLAYDDIVAVFPDGGAQRIQKFVGQFVHNIQSDARHAFAKPFG